MPLLIRVQNLSNYDVALALVLACTGTSAGTSANAQAEHSSFPTQSRYADQQTGMPVVAPNSRQLTNPVSGQSTFNGFNRQLTDPTTGASTFNGYSIKLTDPTTGQSTFNGYSIKLTDPQTGAPTFKGYGENPLMQNRQSAPDFKWNSNVDGTGKSQYSGFGRDPLTTSEGRSTFIGNNRKLTDENGAPSFIGNNRQLSDPNARKDFLKQSQFLRPSTGHQSYINGRSFPGVPQMTPPAVPSDGNQQMPVSTSVSAEQRKQNDNTDKPSSSLEPDNGQTAPVGKQENPPAGAHATESGSGF